MPNLEAIVRDIIRARATRLGPGGEVPADVSLGAAGLGLDSIAIAEVLLECQDRFGVPVASLLEGEPLTLRRLVAHFERETPA